MAVVQDQCVEIGSAEDDSGPIAGKHQASEEPSPRQRQVACSHYCVLSACADSAGSGRMFGYWGSEPLVIPPTPGFPGGPSHAAASIVLEYRAHNGRLSRLALVTAVN